MEFITTGNRIAVENFSIGKIYTIVWATGNYKSLACVGKGSDFVMFQDQAPDLLFCLTMDTAITVESIEEGGSAGTMNYDELENKPSINGIVLVGNKTGADLNLVSQADLDDYATNASVVAGLATKQDALSSSQLAAVNSGITSADVAQITTNKNNILTVADSGGVKNIFNPTYNTTLNPSNFTGTVTRNADNTYTLNGTNSSSVSYITLGNITLNPGSYVLYGRPDDNSGLYLYDDGLWIDSDTYDRRYISITETTTKRIYIRIAANTVLTDYTIYPMICTNSQWDISKKYEPYALSNAELTAAIQALQAQLANQ